jgi:hypothetical protein
LYEIMSRKITLNIKGGSDKQYSTLVLELNLIAKSWNKFGVTITMPNHERIINWGSRKHNDEDISTKVRN